jgi:uncharacterized protein
VIELTIEEARRLAIVKQRLGAKQPKPTFAGIRDVARDLRAIQIDPINVVDRTQNLVVRSRLGNFDRKLLDRLTWKEKFLFTYWAHAASFVLTEDLPLHRYRMKSAYSADAEWTRRAKAWMETNRKLRDHILRTLKRKGPLRARDIEDISAESWQSSGWTAERNVDRMLSMLWVTGKILITGREGIERVWDLTTRWLPEWAPKGTMTERQVVDTAAQLSLKALGVGTPQHIKEHFIRGDYPGLPQALDRLEKKQLVHRARITGVDGRPLPGKWYLHCDDLALTKKLDATATPRTTLLSPFDNLICDRKRTELLWDFHYRIEIYVPKAQRKFGYYSLPILHHDELIGRVDSKADRKEGVLTVNALHFEPGVKPAKETGKAVSGALHELAGFVADGNLKLPSSVVPRAWRPVVNI